MTSIRMERLEISMARPGPRSPMASIERIRVHDARVGDDIPSSVTRNMAYGRVSSIVPYRMVDDYGRERSIQSIPVAIVENERIRATFLTSLGGRLWSIFDKVHQQELLYQSAAIQPANFSLTNAWFAGGVEWNISTIGHSPFSFEPFHVGLAEDASGRPVLRMYDFERLRGTPFQIDVSLPDGSSFLLVHVRIRNPSASAIPIYWWSNLAVPEAPGVRVLAPADDAFLYSPEGDLTRVDVPGVEGLDASSPASAVSANSYYFNIPTEERPWIAALDARGCGLLHTSTARLHGRKMFAWGQSPAGQRWQSFLTGPGRPYFEIQAGLAQTQLEHLPIPPRGSWSWVEAYGRIEIEPTDAHGPWDHAVSMVRRTLADVMPLDRLESIEHEFVAGADTPLVETLQAGSGWGALEDRRRLRSQEPSLAVPAAPFPASSIGQDQAPWIHLLEAGALPDALPSDQPPGDVGPAWEGLLRASPATWLSQLQLGVILFARDAWPEARAAWESSLHRSESAWALRYLARLDLLEGDAGSAADRLARAVVLMPGERRLLLELLRALIDAGRPQQALAYLDSLTETERTDGRVRLLDIRASLAVGDLDRAAAIFASDLTVPDLTEDNVIVAELWYELQAGIVAAATGRALDEGLGRLVRSQHPIPPRYDFRISRPVEG